MKKIGLIGGITWQSTKLYYEYLNTMVAEALGEKHSCKCILESVNFSEISVKQHDGDWETLHEEMAEISKKLEVAGADVILICANTMHLSADTIKQKISVPLLHIAEVTGRAIQEKGIQKVLLLGTKYTMELDFYKDILKNQFGIQVLIPEADDRLIIHQVIYDELAKGIISEDSKEQYQQIIKNSELEGAEGVVLGCTEIPLLIKQEDCDVPVFDTTKIHAAAAVNFALDNNSIQ